VNLTREQYIFLEELKDRTVFKERVEKLLRVESYLLGEYNIVEFWKTPEVESFLILNDIEYTERKW
jgi:hypothetical protein